LLLDEATQKQLARGQRLRELLKQPQNNPFSVAQQVALIYTGINGYLDDLQLSQVKSYCASLITYLATSKKAYIDIVTSTNQFTPEAEASLKEAISESKAAFAKANA
jgi:F-type H+-transporting ATPase subunit alpha